MSRWQVVAADGTPYTESDYPREDVAMAAAHIHNNQHPDGAPHSVREVNGMEVYS